MVITYDDWLVDEVALEEDETLLALDIVRLGSTRYIERFDLRRRACRGRNAGGRSGNVSLIILNYTFMIHSRKPPIVLRMLIPSPNNSFVASCSSIETLTISKLKLTNLRS